jgi:hypothetical protein
MSHQPFEQWVLDGDQSLSREDKVLLTNHLDECNDCSQLQEQWKSAEQLLKQAPIYQAPEGFTFRWKKSFLTRKAVQQQLNKKRILYFLFFGSFISLLMYLSLSILSGSPINILINILKNSSALAVRISKLNLFFYSILSYLPPAIPIILLILLSCSLILMLALWGLTFWQYSIKGVVPNEDYQ